TGYSKFDYFPTLIELVSKGVLEPAHLLQVLRTLSQHDSHAADSYLPVFINLLLQPNRDDFWLLNEIEQIHSTIISDVIVEELRKNQIASKMADPLFQTLGNLLVNGTTDRQGALKILSESRIHQYNDSREYYSYIEEVGSKFPGDAEIGVIIRKYILPILYER